MKPNPKRSLPPEPKEKQLEQVAVRRQRSTLVFSPAAFLELTFYCHQAHTEVAAMGVSAAHDPLYIERIELLDQAASACFVELDDEAVADHIVRHAEQGISPARCGRIWIHTHPGHSAAPSVTDEQTFARAFGGCEWSVMTILARGGQTYARMQLAALPALPVVLPVQIDWSTWPDGAAELMTVDHLADWRQRLSRVRQETEVHRGLWFDHDLISDSDWMAAFELREAELNGFHPEVGHDH